MEEKEKSPLKEKKTAMKVSSTEFKSNFSTKSASFIPKFARAEAEVSETVVSKPLVEQPKQVIQEKKPATLSNQSSSFKPFHPSPS